MSTNYVCCDKCGNSALDVSPKPPEERWCNQCVLTYPQERRELMQAHLMKSWFKKKES